MNHAIEALKEYAQDLKDSKDAQIHHIDYLQQQIKEEQCTYEKIDAEYEEILRAIKILEALPCERGTSVGSECGLIWNHDTNTWDRI